MAVMLAVADTDFFADLIFGLDGDKAAAGRVLSAEFRRMHDALYTDVLAREAVYEAAIHAALPTMPEADREKLAAWWQELKAWIAASPEERVAMLEASWQDRSDDGSSLDWMAPFFDVFEPADKPLITDSDMATLADIAGPLEYWLWGEVRE